MANEPAAADAASWRDLAVARSLDPARVRAEKRVQRFLDAALELMSSSDSKDFTVQQVVERSGQSLRSFYQYFAGKYELLLALFEESVRNATDHVDRVVAAETEPLEKLRSFVIEYDALCRPPKRGAAGAGAGAAPSAVAEFAQQLLTEHPTEAARAFAPLVALLEQVLDEAAAAGAIRAGLDHRRLAGVILQTIAFNTFSLTISGTDRRAAATTGADDLWTLLLHGIVATA